MISVLPFFFILASFSGIAVLFGSRFYAARNIQKKELYETVVSSKRFFEDFNYLFLPIFDLYRDLLGWAKNIFLNLLYKSVNFLDRRTCSFRGKVKFYHCRFANFLHGRHTLKNNGCAGYWHELNQCKNGNGDDAENKEVK